MKSAFVDPEMFPSRRTLRFRVGNGIKDRQPRLVAQSISVGWELCTWGMVKVFPIYEYLQLWPEIWNV